MNQILQNKSNMYKTMLYKINQLHFLILFPSVALACWFGLLKEGSVSCLGWLLFVLLEQGTDAAGF
jgi:hypothetical protein